MAYPYGNATSLSHAISRAALSLSLNVLKVGLGVWHMFSLSNTLKPRQTNRMLVAVAFKMFRVFSPFFRQNIWHTHTEIYLYLICIYNKLCNYYIWLCVPSAWSKSTENELVVLGFVTFFHVYPWGVAQTLFHSEWMNFICMKRTLVTFTTHCEPVLRQGQMLSVLTSRWLYQPTDYINFRKQFMDLAGTHLQDGTDGFPSKISHT